MTFKTCYRKIRFTLRRNRCKRYIFIFFLFVACFIIFTMKTDREYLKLTAIATEETHDHGVGEDDSTVKTVLSSKDVQPACHLPKVNPFNEEMMKYIKDFGTLNCKGSPSPAYLDENGVLKVRGKNISSVEYTAIFRHKEDDYSVWKGRPVKIPLKKLDSGEMFGEIQIPEQCIQVDMAIAQMGGLKPAIKSTEYFLNAPKQEEIDKRALQWPKIPLSVVVVLFDSTSAANFQRKMPKTGEFLKDNPDAVMLKGYTIVGDGTDRALSAFLTGEHEGSNPEARRGIAGADTVDRWPWVFKEFKEKGYATLYSEDYANFAAFNYRMLGFKKPPADFYGRPLFIESDKNGYKLYCLQSQKRHLMLQQFVKTMYSSYPNRPKFAVVVSSLGHDDLNEVQWIDQDILDLFKWAKKDAYTLMIFMSDHGIRYGPGRTLMQGQLEERLPFISMVFPSWFKEKFPDLFKSLKGNENVLTTPFDLHATFRHILKYPEIPDSKYGQSLFSKINVAERTCDNSGVKVYFCPCLSWNEISSEDNVVLDLAKKTVDEINAKMSSFTTGECEILSLSNITRALRQFPNENVRKYKDIVWDKSKAFQPTSYILGEMSKDNMMDQSIYQIQLFVKPSDAHFEVTIPFVDGKADITLESIHRLNKYGSQPDCIKQKYPHLAYFCLCKTLVKNENKI